MIKSIKWMLLGTTLALLVAGVISGTLANEPSAELKISISELQRITIDDDKIGTDNLEPFRDFKLLVPIYNEPLTLTDKGQSWNGGGADKLYSDKTKNVVDKFVFVENNGTTPAFVRVWFAFEQGTVSKEVFIDSIGTLKNTTAWSWDESKTQYGVEIDGNTYVVMCAVYNNTLEGGSATTNPSLLQVWMHHDVSGEASQMLDGNKNGTYDILVRAEGVQYDKDKAIANWLDEAYGINHPWQE